VDFTNRVIYYVGPVDPVRDEVVGPAGPTTATRMDKFTEMMLAKTGLIAMVGKAERGPTAIEAIRGDMQGPRPMDRLLCGDVGFGKTEMAMRAAFKAVEAGYQVAVLVPTTVLAEQHRRSFTARFSEFPFTIRGLSRFSTAQEERDTLEGLARGTVDVVIGTHRLAQADIHFANLGMLVVDEEQRFGVDVKEKLKALRASIDVLTMTATPIPRTLHMSMLGIRDISNLTTPPANRIAVETRVSRWDNALIKSAIDRELARGGQVFFVHNRIHDIHKVAQRLAQIVRGNIGELLQFLVGTRECGGGIAEAPFGVAAFGHILAGTDDALDFAVGIAE
jgi:transcription-repair coupling factor (superfamily II helicase)